MKLFGYNFIMAEMWKSTLRNKYTKKKKKKNKNQTPIRFFPIKKINKRKGSDLFQGLQFLYKK